MTLKESLYSICLSYVQERIVRITKEIESVQTSANEENKSSAGDKHETGRAMAQLEIEKNSKQLQEAKRLEAQLAKIQIDNISDRIIAGSLVTTTNGIFFISISMGVVTYKEQPYFFISPDSPLGMLFLDKKVMDEISFNGKKYVVLAIG
ncbi:MAG: hypothetical protein J0M08_09725 [Bacteroidetes bacterium]|nr:hypothetical protein [Bacteroidota bacterium]